MSLGRPSWQQELASEEVFHLVAERKQRKREYKKEPGNIELPRTCTPVAFLQPEPPPKVCSTSQNNATS
jgi:hypothetical protein